MKKNIMTTSIQSSAARSAAFVSVFLLLFTLSGCASDNEGGGSATGGADTSGTGRSGADGDGGASSADSGDDEGRCVFLSLEETQALIPLELEPGDNNQTYNCVYKGVERRPAVRVSILWRNFVTDLEAHLAIEQEEGEVWEAVPGYNAELRHDTTGIDEEVEIAGCKDEVCIVLEVAMEEGDNVRGIAMDLLEIVWPRL